MGFESMAVAVAVARPSPGRWSMAILSNFHGPEPHFPIKTGIPGVDAILRQINDEIEISPRFPQLLCGMEVEGWQ